MTRVTPYIKRPGILAHRMLIPGYPENTILSLKKVIEERIEWIEFDVQVLKDGTIVSMHDSTVDRTTDGTGILTEKTWEEVKKLNAGKGYNFGFVPVPRVEEILKEISNAPYKIKAEMHIHNLDEPERLHELLKKYNLVEQCYYNTDLVVLAQYLREDLKADNAKISFNIATTHIDPYTKPAIDYDIDYYCVSLKVLSKELVEKIHKIREEKPIFVHSYPVQSPSQWEDMLEYDVDVIQTDYPLALREFLSEKGFSFE